MFPTHEYSRLDIGRQLRTLLGGKGSGGRTFDIDLTCALLLSCGFFDRSASQGIASRAVPLRLLPGIIASRWSLKPPFFKFVLPREVPHRSFCSLEDLVEQPVLMSHQSSFKGVPLRTSIVQRYRLDDLDQAPAVAEQESAINRRHPVQSSARQRRVLGQLLEVA